jgi:hypothetical protein
VVDSALAKGQATQLGSNCTCVYGLDLRGLDECPRSGVEDNADGDLFSSHVVALSGRNRRSTPLAACPGLAAGTQAP